MKCLHGDHDELRRGDFIYRGAAGRGMGVLGTLRFLPFYSFLSHTVVWEAFKYLLTWLVHQKGQERQGPFCFPE